MKKGQVVRIKKGTFDGGLKEGTEVSFQRELSDAERMHLIDLYSTQFQEGHKMPSAKFVQVENQNANAGTVQGWAYSLWGGGAGKYMVVDAECITAT